MPGGLEKAATGRSGVFPAEWGVPAGAQYSEERARWVADRVREHRSLAVVRRRAALVSAVRQRAGGENVRRQRELLLKRH